MKALHVTLLIVFVCLAQQVEISGGPVQSQNNEWLKYDDGTSNWLTWDGTYRGVWFNIEDFIPGANSWTVGTVETWFYHHSSYPWDTSEFLCEVWNGDASGPATLLGQVQSTAVHNSAVYTNFDPQLTTQGNFWCITNTEISSGGWPSNLSDNMQGSVNHSFLSDDSVIWEPWEMFGGACNYFIRNTFDWELAPCSWGSIKSVF